MQPGAQNLVSRHSSHTANSCGGDNVSKSSLLDQQFRRFDTPQIQSRDHSSPLGFPLEAHLQQQNQTLQQPSSSQSHSQSLAHCEQLQSQHERTNYESFHQASFPFGYSSGFGDQAFQDSSLTTLDKPTSTECPSLTSSSSRAFLDSLSVLQQKIHQLQAVVQLMIDGSGQSATGMSHEQAIAAGVTSIISQVVVATAGMLRQSTGFGTQAISADLQFNAPFEGSMGSIYNLFQSGVAENSMAVSLGMSMGSLLNISTIPAACAPLGFPGGVNTSFGCGVGGSGIGGQDFTGQGMNSSCGTCHSSLPSNFGHPLNTTDDRIAGTTVNLGVGRNEEGCGAANHLMVHGSGGLQVPFEDHDSVDCLRDEEDDGETENLPPGSYELVEMDAEEILAEHTHFCEICGKGFKRDANLRMHMRGHGDEYKTPAALARPDRPSQDHSMVRLRRFSCPFVGCKRNKKHRKFLPLKTLLCVKNHYRRSHCPKVHSCSKCKNKKFSVVADLKTHEKHCGRDKWQCSCGTTFSRKDKLVGHIGLFAGHKPALPLHEVEVPGTGLDLGEKTSGAIGLGHSSGTSLGGSSATDSIFLIGSGSNNFGHGNGADADAALLAGNGSVMDVGHGSGMVIAMGGSIKRDGGVRAQLPTSGSLSLCDDDGVAALGEGSLQSGSLVPDSSMLHDLLSSNFLEQTNGNDETSSDGIR
eukprot:c26414_g2_i1 orf=668-2755(+)